MLVYNVGFGGITSGIGAIINTPKGRGWKKNFIKSFWQGCLGGALQYSGKKTVFLINKNQSLAAAWPAKLQHAAGISIIENAAANKPFLQNWNIDLWPLRMDYSFATNQFRMRFLPTTIYTCIEGFTKGRLELSSSLMSGVFIFKTDKLIADNNVGASYGRGIVYYNDFDKYHTIAHEYIHGFQFGEYVCFNSWLNPITNKTSSTIKSVFQKYIYADIPYYYIFYGLEGQHPLYYYYRNFFEFEAERFSTNSYVPVH